MLAKLVRVTTPHCATTRWGLRRAFGSTPKDPYQVLKVSRSATQKEIKDSFHQLTKKYHPDVNGGDPAQYKAVLDAYHILGNADKRASFDIESGKVSGVKPNQSDFDPLLMFFRSKYKNPPGTEEEPFVPPHMKGEKRKRPGESEQYGEESKLVEWLLGVSLVIGLGASIHRYQQLKNIPMVYPEDEDRAEMEANLKDPHRLIRLNEAECKNLSLDELEMLDRSQNYVLPLSYKMRIKEYREVYKIPSPEEDIDAARQAMSQFKARTKGKQLLGKSRDPSPEDGDLLSGFDYSSKFNSAETSK